MEELQLNEREMEQVKACLAYYNMFSTSGLPGHSTMVLVAKLYKSLAAVSTVLVRREDERAAFISFIQHLTMDEMSVEAIEEAIRQGLENAANVEDTPEA